MFASFDAALEHLKTHDAEKRLTWSVEHRLFYGERRWELFFVRGFRDCVLLPEIDASSATLTGAVQEACRHYNLAYNESTPALATDAGTAGCDAGMEQETARCQR